MRQLPELAARTVILANEIPIHQPFDDRTVVRDVRQRAGRTARQLLGHHLALDPVAHGPLDAEVALRRLPHRRLVVARQGLVVRTDQVEVALSIVRKPGFLLRMRHRLLQTTWSSTGST